MDTNIMIRKILTKILSFLFRFSSLNKIFSIIKSIDRFESIELENKEKIFFLDTNWITRFRFETFYTKEPETISWIKDFKRGIFWDIGAYVGLYSIYSSKIVKNLKVFAFEPSIFNLEILIKNIYKNQKQDDIKIITNPISDFNKFDYFYLSTIEKGGANSSFGKKIENQFSYKTNSLSCDNLKNIYNLDEPNYVKIDVDGNELEILKSIFATFKNIESFLVEVNEDQEEIFSLMEKNNYKLVFNKEDRTNKIWKKII